MKLNPYFEVILAAIIWGSTGFFVKTLDLPPTTMAFFRLAVPTLLLFIFFSFTKVKLFEGNNKMMLIASSLNAVRMFLYFVGFTFTTIGNAVILLYTKPIFVVLLSLFFLKEKIPARNYFYLILSFVGTAFVLMGNEFSIQNEDSIGMVAMLFSALIVAIATTIYKKESDKYSKFEMVFYQNLVGAFVFIPFIFINIPVPNIQQVSIASVYAILIGIVGFGLFFSAIKRIKLSTASILSYVEVVSGVLFGIIFFNEILTWNIVIGGTLIVTSSILLKK